ncbi:MAG TPA: NAD(P)H-binding protein [Flavitalea sp.]|nr:NAD(P)H-binding protein [Flavitalea sp.]
MNNRTAVLIGSTGLIGQEVLNELLEDPDFSTVRILVRKPVSITHPKLQVMVVDFDDENDYKQKTGTGDSVFCCVGTTQKKVKGDLDAYERVDFLIPLNAARFAKEAGFRCYALISSVGADDQAKNFYLRLKGKTEKAIVGVHLPATHIFRPSILLGDRRESRLGEEAAKKIMQGLSFALAGGLSKYKPIHAANVAEAMVRLSKKDDEGVFIHHYAEMK